jgi:hypothetical protein
MLVCIICRFELEIDDVAIEAAGGHAVCVRCYARETENKLPMPKSLRQEIVAALNESEVA